LIHFDAFKIAFKKVFLSIEYFRKCNTSKHNRTYRIYVSALYNFISSMKGLRLFERFGFDLPANKTRERKTTIQITDYE